MIKIEPIRVLHIVGNMNMGGQETFIMNVYRKLDREKIQFDFVVHSKEKGYYDNEIETLGGKIYRIPKMSTNIMKHSYYLGKIIKENRYDIVHRHTNSSIVFIDLLIAKLLKVNKRIVHSHSNNNEQSKWIHNLFKKILNQVANKRFACSESAGKWLYSKNKYTVLPNGIDISKFIYDPNIRNKIRNTENSKDKIVLGHVGRFEKEKNHKFLIEVVKEIVQKNQNIELWLIGKGTLENEIKNKVKELNIEKYVKFMGIKNNVNEYMQAMDIFLLPSIYEGLGIVLIEAQITGMRCIASENIQEEAIITNHVQKVNLDKRLWKDAILSEINEETALNRKIDLQDNRIKQYDINYVVKILSEYYLGEKNGEETKVKCD